MIRYNAVFFALQNIILSSYPTKSLMATPLMSMSKKARSGFFLDSSGSDV